MTDSRDNHSDTHVDLEGDEFERLGRQAGAEMRMPPTAEGARAIERTAHRRRAVIAAAAVGSTLVILVIGLLVVTTRPNGQPAPIATVAPTTASTPASVPVPASTAVATTVPPDTKDLTAPDAIRTTTPGTWRKVAETSFAPELPTAAIWTGTEVIVIGSSANGDSGLSAPFAVAYDVGQDQWRRLADPPPAITTESLDRDGSAMQWTGSEVLIATDQAEVYSYDPEQDRWESRASADKSMSGADPLVAVSAHGVLARSSAGWWWYDSSTDRWESVPAPSSGAKYSSLSTLDQDRIVATLVDGATITLAVFDIDTRTWRNGPVVENGPVGRDPTGCSAHDGLLVCSAEGYGSFNGVVIDPLVGALDSFGLGSHSNNISANGTPWLAHAGKLLSPRSATWEDLPPSLYSDVDSFDAAVWTGSEIIFFGNYLDQSGEPITAAAYTPLEMPGK